MNCEHRNWRENSWQQEKHAKAISWSTTGVNGGTFNSFGYSAEGILICVSAEKVTFTWWGCYGLCFWHKPTELAHSFFYSVLVSVSVFMGLSTVFHSINSPDNTPLSHSVLPVLFVPYRSFQLYISLRKSPSALIQFFLCVVYWA